MVWPSDTSSWLQHTTPMLSMVATWCLCPRHSSDLTEVYTTNLQYWPLISTWTLGSLGKSECRVSLVPSLIVALSFWRYKCRVYYDLYHFGAGIQFGLGSGNHTRVFVELDRTQGRFVLPHSHKRTTFDHRFKLKPSGDSNSCNLARRSMTHIIEVCSSRLRSATLQLKIVQKCGSIVKSHNGVSLWRAAKHLAAEPVSRWYLTLFVVSLGVGIGCLYGSGTSQPLMPWWSVLLFTALSAFFAVFLGFSESASSLRNLFFFSDYGEHLDSHSNYRI